MLITGGSGMLATDLAVAASETYDVVALSHADLDITDSGRAVEAIQSIRPAVLINTPGLAVDLCEQDAAQGFRLHTWATGVLARACESIDAAFVYISTCGLFGDEIRYYHEYDPVVLKTQYARSKYLGEQAAALSCRRTCVIRPGWLFGGTPEHRRNFAYQRFLEARRSPVLRSASDKHGSPTYTFDLAAAILRLIDHEACGVFHVTNAGGGSRYEYVKCIVETFGLPTSVEPVDSAAFPRAAPVPECEMLENLNLRFVGLPLLRPWQEALRAYVRSLPLGYR